MPYRSLNTYSFIAKYSLFFSISSSLPKFLSFFFRFFFPSLSVHFILVCLLYANKEFGLNLPALLNEGQLLHIIQLDSTM